MQPSYSSSPTKHEKRGKFTLRSFYNTSILLLTFSCMGSLLLINQEELKKAMITPKDAGALNSTIPCTSMERLTSILEQSHDIPIGFSKTIQICPSAAYNHIHIVIPFYNLSPDTINKAIQSVNDQEYPPDRYTIWLYDDASTNQTVNGACNNVIFDFPIPQNKTWPHADQIVSEIGLTKANSPQLLCFRSTQHLGPGGSKYWLFGLVQTIAEPNDVVLILDGDDTLHHRQALQIVNQKYLDKMAWFTYGSYEGKWGNQIKDLPMDIRKGKRHFYPRNTTWVYGHPRSFKSHLLDHITQDDFKHSNGHWLTKGTDRGFIYRMLELSGPDRIGYIPTKIYTYNYSPTTSTVATVSKELRIAQIRHTQEMPSSQPLIVPLQIVLFFWKNIDILKEQLISLENQIGIETTPVHVRVVNNNWIEKAAVNRLIHTLEKKVTVIHTTGASQPYFAKFAYVDQLRRSIPVDRVVILDETRQYWPSHFLATLLKEPKPASWYGIYIS